MIFIFLRESIFGFTNGSVFVNRCKFCVNLYFKLFNLRYERLNNFFSQELSVIGKIYIRSIKKKHQTIEKFEMAKMLMVNSTF